MIVKQSPWLAHLTKRAPVYVGGSENEGTLFWSPYTKDPAI